MRNLLVWRSLAIAIAFMGALVAAHAIDTNTRIKGVVSDPQGSVVSGAHVTAINTATQVKFETVSGAEGAYLFPQLPVGTYTISATAAGFKAFGHRDRAEYRPGVCSEHPARCWIDHRGGRGERIVGPREHHRHAVE
jgi:hypothetical protein